MYVLCKNDATCSTVYLYLYSIGISILYGGWIRFVQYNNIWHIWLNWLRLQFVFNKFPPFWLFRSSPDPVSHCAPVLDDGNSLYSIFFKMNVSWFSINLETLILLACVIILRNPFSQVVTVYFCLPCIFVTATLSIISEKINHHVVAEKWLADCLDIISA